MVYGAAPSRHRPAHNGHAGRRFLEDRAASPDLRALAQRSADAARKITTIVGESRAMIDAGTQLAHEAGKTATETLGAASEAADLMQAVEHTTQQQTAAFTDLSLTIKDLINARHNNFALVAELGAAADELAAHKMELSEQMGRLPHATPANGSTG